MTAPPGTPPAVAVTLHSRAAGWPPWRASPGSHGDCSLAALVADLGVPHRGLASAVLGGGIGWVRTWLNVQVPRCYARRDPDRHLATLATGLPGPVVGMLTAVPVAGYHHAAHGSAVALATVGVGHALAAAGAPPPWQVPSPATVAEPCPPCVAAAQPAMGPPRHDCWAPRPGPGVAARRPEQPAVARADCPPPPDREVAATRPAAGASRHGRLALPPGPGAPARCSEPLPITRAGRCATPFDPDDPAVPQRAAWSAVPEPAGTINLLVVTSVPLTDAALAGALQTVVEAKAQALAAAGIRAANAPGFATGTATDAACVACPPGARVPYAGPRTRHGADLAAAVFAAVSTGAAVDCPSGSAAHAR